MKLLETIFNLSEFDLKDNVLVEFNNYFDEESRDYNSFCLDEGDILTLRRLVAQIKSIDAESAVYVCTYGCEITNSKGEKSTYADALWIDTILPISQIEELIGEHDVIEPSDISLLEECDDIGKGKVWLVTQKEQNPQIVELTDNKKIDHMIVLYWD